MKTSMFSVNAGVGLDTLSLKEATLLLKKLSNIESTSSNTKHISRDPPKTKLLPSRNRLDGWHNFGGGF